ncbi:MAG: hypothetical protein VKK04_16355, partial [Synechococcales bacterium]|nr:hypothetical protein [Synechococcales bacterium]
MGEIVCLMLLPSDLLERFPTDWLVGEGGEQLAIAFQQRTAQLSRWGTPTVLVAEADPVRFLAGFLAACAAGCPVALGNPTWGRSERRQALALVRPDLIWTDEDWPNVEPQSSRLPSRPEPGWMLIPTGGSSGQLRFAIHTWETLMASVAGFRQHFGVER